MNAPARFDFWQKRRASVETKRNRKSITLGAFSAECGYQDNYSVYSDRNDTANYATVTDVSMGLTDNFTYEFWCKLIPTPTAGGHVLLTRSSLNFIIFVDDTGLLTVYHTNGGSYGGYVSLNAWHHIAVTVSFSVDAAIKVYVDGVLTGSGVLTGALTGGLNTVSLGSDVTSWIGHIGDFRVWNVVRTQFEIETSFRSRRKGNETGLLAYFKISEGTGTTIADSVGALTLTMTGTTWSLTELWPFRFGASFVAAQWDITLDQKTSLKFPVARPDGCTFMLVVRYLDDNGDTQRMKMWDLDGVDIGPAPVMYAGEKLPLNFTLEAWNVDGAATVDLISNLILYTGETSIPINDGDHASQVAQDPTLDTTLAANFPLTPFPIVFNTQQIY